jgi:DNA mismatch endonuclease Vsr
VDYYTPAARSAHMSRIRRANTRPELFVRKLLTRLGYRYRIQLRGIPGRPDVAFPARRKAIFIHGCFWHFHGCDLSRVPKTRTDFWLSKFAKNKERDRRLLNAASEAGWESLILWECELGDTARIAPRLAEFLGPTRVARPNPARSSLVTLNRSSNASASPNSPPATVSSVALSFRLHSPKPVA